LNNVPEGQQTIQLPNATGRNPSIRNPNGGVPMSFGQPETSKVTSEGFYGISSTDEMDKGADGSNQIDELDDLLNNLNQIDEQPEFES